MNARLILFLGCLSLTRLWALSQDTHRHQTDFTPEEFEARRAQIFDAIGEEAFALVQGAASTRGFIVFRQSNQFYYLTGVEVPHAYLLLEMVSALSDLDLALARAKYAEDLEAAEPAILGFKPSEVQLHPGVTIQLRGARHPL